MKQLVFVFIAVLFLSTSRAQTKYYIYFKDKGVESTSKLNKTSSAYQIAESQLSSRAIERRKRVLGEQNFISYTDLPLNQNYIHQLETNGIKIENQLKWFNSATAYLTKEQVNAITSLPFIQKVVPVKLFSNSKASNNTGFEPMQVASVQSTNALDYGYSLNQNNLSEIPPVHNLGIHGEGVVIGVLDAGFNWKRSSVFNEILVLGEYDFVKHDSITSNQTTDETNVGQDSHGTSVLSIIGGYMPGKLIGPAYKSSYYLAKTEDVSSEKHVEEDNYAAALEWLEAKGVDITTSSLGYNLFDSSEPYSYTYNDMNGNTSIIAQALNLAFDRGVSTFTAAGNEGDKSNWYYLQNLGGNTFGKIVTPADAFNVITVGAVDETKKAALFSSRGPTYDGRIKPEVCAMGVKDVSVISGTNSFGSGDGTSYATPIAAGIGALLKSVYPHLTNGQVRKIFLECSDQTEYPDNNKGYGIISAKSVLCYPNLEQTGSDYKVNKILIDDNGVHSVQMFYRINNGSFQKASISFDGSKIYTTQLPSSNTGSLVEFYFLYKENDSTSIKVPAEDDKYFKFAYGSLNISSLTGVDETKNEIPKQYYLSQNYPNPFNPSTTIEYSIPAGKVSALLVSLKVYDLLGREIATMVNEYKTAGNYKTQFNTSAFNGSILPSGIYFYRLTAGDFVQSKKMILIK
jgi:serine protease AprX